VRGEGGGGWFYPCWCRGNHPKIPSQTGGAWAARRPNTGLLAVLGLPRVLILVQLQKTNQQRGGGGGGGGDIGPTDAPQGGAPIYLPRKTPGVGATRQRKRLDQWVGISEGGEGIKRAIHCLSMMKRHRGFWERSFRRGGDIGSYGNLTDFYKLDRRQRGGSRGI